MDNKINIDHPVEVNKNSLFGYFFQPDPLLGWKMIPGRQAWYTKSGFRTFIRINNQGFRGCDFDREKKNGEFRILVLADSFGAGFEVDEDKLFISALERTLNDKYYPVKIQIINTGTGGYGTEQEYLLLKQVGKQFKPDLILLGFHFGDDIIENSMALSKRVGWRLVRIPRPYHKILDDGSVQLVNYPPPMKEIKKAWLSYYDQVEWELRQKISMPFPITFDNRLSHLFRRIVDKFNYQITKYLRLRQIPIDILVYSTTEREEFKDAWMRTAKFIELINQQSMEIKSKLVVFGVCTKEQIIPQLLLDRLTKFPQFQSMIDPMVPQNKLKAILDQLNIPFIDLYPGFNDDYNQQNIKLFHQRDLHWNEQGHALASSILAQEMAPFLGFDQKPA